MLIPWVELENPAAHSIQYVLEPALIRSHVEYGEQHKWQRRARVFVLHVEWRGANAASAASSRLEFSCCCVFGLVLWRMHRNLSGGIRAKAPLKIIVLKFSWTNEFFTFSFSPTLSLAFHIYIPDGFGLLNTLSSERARCMHCDDDDVEVESSLVPRASSWGVLNWIFFLSARSATSLLWRFMLFGRRGVGKETQQQSEKFKLRSSGELRGTIWRIFFCLLCQLWCNFQRHRNGQFGENC